MTAPAAEFGTDAWFAERALTINPLRRVPIIDGVLRQAVAEALEWAAGRVYDHGSGHYAAWAEHGHSDLKSCSEEWFGESNRLRAKAEEIKENGTHGN